MKRPVTLNVNGDSYLVHVDPRERLLDALRDRLGLTGSKEGCGTGDCGCCTVILDGRPVVSCLVLAVQANDRPIETIESLSRGGKLHPIQQAFVDHTALQCGICIPGFIMASKALLDRNPNPTEEDVRFELAGNLCRCTGYVKIVEAVMDCVKQGQAAAGAP